MSVSEAFSYHYLNVLRGAENDLSKYSPSDANQPARGTSSALDLTSLPGECAAQILAFVGTPSNALVCKSWNIFSQQSYFFTAQGYEQDPDVRRYMPPVVNNPNNPSLEIVQKTYRAIINTTNAAGAEVLFANLKRETPLSLHPVVRMIEDVNLIRFFDRTRLWSDGSRFDRPLNSLSEMKLSSSFQSNGQSVVSHLNGVFRNNIGENPSTLLGEVAEEAVAIRTRMRDQKKTLDPIVRLKIRPGIVYGPQIWFKGRDRLGLTILPVEITYFVNLQQLDLADNRLTILPPEMTKLIKLKSLDLSGNRLTSIPPEIFQMTSLTSLNFFDNRITAIPPELVRLKRLSQLNISKNQITASPQEIFSQLKLECYFCDKNPFGSTL